MASYIINLDSRDLRTALNSNDEAIRAQARALQVALKSKLAQLHQHRNRITYAHLELLDLFGEANTYIEEHFTGISRAMTGAITSGSINLDGSSAMRRACTLGIAITDNVLTNNYYWTLNSKFQAWIGLENMLHLDFSTYINYIDDLITITDLVTEVKDENQLSLGDNIIWLNQGQFIISSFSAQQTTNNWNINISGKDLMCQLNGEIGGTFVAEETLNQYEDYYTNPGEMMKVDMTLDQTVRSIVGRFCPNTLIVTDDLKKEQGSRLYKYIGDSTLYGLVQYDDTLQENTLRALTVFGDQPVYNSLGILTTIDKCSENSIIALSGNEYKLRKVEYGEQFGYQEIEYYYADALKVSPGDNAITALERVKSAFAGFEYFFDLNGDFIFRKKKGYIELAASDQTGEEQEIEYLFEDANMLTSMSVTPSLADFKNDYVVWGTKKSSNGVESDLLMHYVFDTKPTEYIAFDKGFTQSEMFKEDNQTYWNLFNGNIQDWKIQCWDGDWIGENDEGMVVSLNSQNFDWRELLYHMALDDNALNTWKILIQKDQQKDIPVLNYSIYVKCLSIIEAWQQEIAPYRSYFPELRAFWRNLYNPEVPMEYREVSNTYQIEDNESLWSYPLIKLNEKPEALDRNNFFVQYNSKLFLWTDTRDLTLYEDLYTIKNHIEYESFYNTTVLPLRKSPTNIYIQPMENQEKNCNIINWSLDQLNTNLSYTPTLFVLLEATYISNNNNLNDTLNGALLRNHELTENTTWEEFSRYPIAYVQENDGTYVRCRILEDFCDENGIPLQQSDIIETYFAHNLYYKKAGGGQEPLFQSNTGNKSIFYKRPNLEIISDEYKDKYSVLSFGVKLSELETIAQSNNGIAYDISWWNSQEQAKAKELYPSGIKPLLFCLLEYLGNTLQFNQLYTWVNNKYQHILTPYTKTLRSSDLYIQDAEDATIYYSLYQKLYDEELSKDLSINDKLQYYCYSLAKVLIESNQDNTENNNNAEDAELVQKKAYRTIQYTDINGEASGEYYYKYYDYYVYTSNYKHDGSIKQKYFSKAYNQDRTSANYWLEFIDPIEIRNVEQQKHWERLLPDRAGRRTKVANEKNVSLLWTPKTEGLNLGDLTPPANELIAISTIGKTAIDTINELLYNHSYATESISLTSIPLYFLQPNTIIRLGEDIRGHNDQNQGVVMAGDYVLTKLSIPLTYNGTSSLTLSRKPDWFDIAWGENLVENSILYTTLGQVANTIWYLSNIDNVSVSGTTLKIGEEEII